MFRLHLIVPNLFGKTRPTLPAKLTQFLSNNLYKKVGVGIGGDKTKLERDFECICNGFLDIRFLSAALACNTPGLRGLAVRNKNK